MLALSLSGRLVTDIQQVEWLTVHPLMAVTVCLYLLPVEGSVLCLYPLGLGGEGENHLGLQAKGQLLVVLLLCTVTWSLAVLVLGKQVGRSLHQQLRGDGRKIGF